MKDATGHKTHMLKIGTLIACHVDNDTYIYTLGNIKEDTNKD